MSTIICHTTPPIPITDMILSFENGELDEDQTLELFSRLISTGIINHLQGSYGRSARDLIEAGIISPTGTILKYVEEL